MERKKIPVSELRLGMYVTELDRPWLDTPFLFQGFPITSSDQIEELKIHCQTLYIDLERDVSNEDMRKHSDAQILVRGPAVYKVVRPVDEEISFAQEIYSACQESVQNSIESIRITGELDSEPLMNAVGNMTRSIERNPDAMLLLYKIKQKGNEEFHRAIDNSIHMISFGRFLQFSADRLELLGLAGMLLDIGKVCLPDTILTKKNTLTTEEFDLTKAHVLHSIELINAAVGLPNGLADIVLQHHERQDGSGYPHGLSGRQITIDGAIAGLVNSYCALTSKRDYAEQLSPSNALSRLYNLRGKLFHEALVEQLIQCIGIYPVGSVVELNSGEMAIVIAQNLVRRLQPRVMIVLDPSGKPARPQIVIDLVNQPKSTEDELYRIVRTISSDQLPFDPEQFFL